AAAARELRVARGFDRFPAFAESQRGDADRRRRVDPPEVRAEQEEKASREKHSRELQADPGAGGVFEQGAAVQPERDGLFGPPEEEHEAQAQARDEKSGNRGGG